MNTPTHLLHALPLWLDGALAALVVIGCAFALVGSWGLAKLTDFLRRLHGPSKATTLGVGCVLIASMVGFTAVGPWSGHELLVTVFLFLTAPVSAHLLVKAALKANPQLKPPEPAAQAAEPPAPIAHR